MTMQIVLEHEVKIGSEENRFEREQVWQGLTYVLLNRHKFSDLFTEIEAIERKEEPGKITQKLRVQMHSGHCIEEVLEFFPEDRVLTTIDSAAHNPRSTLEIRIVRNDNGQYALHFTHKEDLKEKAERKLEHPREIQGLIHNAWKLKDEELTAGVLGLLLKGNVK